jgi:hypothetical protein
LHYAVPLVEAMLQLLDGQDRLLPLQAASVRFRHRSLGALLRVLCSMLHAPCPYTNPSITWPPLTMGTGRPSGVWYVFVVSIPIWPKTVRRMSATP